ncbi:MAG: nickel pincer cofactor biosynthesis protein LarB, partial [Elusimicrobiota bacterium]|nr:nickel pincer cofactor biosynthesis protein LarB [Elusimicrobiota bacterium]
ERQSLPIIATRASPSVYRAVKKKIPTAKYYPKARIIAIDYKKSHASMPAYSHTHYICVVTAGTTDIPVAEECAVTCELLGTKVERIYDVGVSGVHRLSKYRDKIQKANCLVVCAGMEGALPSIVGGLVSCPVVGVPTSVGYGMNFSGISALLTMLNSCAPNVCVVNIDDGFGAGVIAHLIAKQK